MPTLHALLDWLSALPPAGLFAAMGALALVENIFPPIPSDVLVAFGGLVAARGQDSPWPAFLSVWGGNVAGALLMMTLGRRFGSEWTERRFGLAKGGDAERRLLRWHARYGVSAFFVSRFIPGLRAVVPPVAGALRIPALGPAMAIATASGLWYGTITWMAFRAGANWNELLAWVGQLGRWTGGIGIALVAMMIAMAWWRLRRER